jgi:hypothetical protein
MVGFSGDKFVQYMIVCYILLAGALLHVEYVANGETFFFLFWICEGSKN